MNNSTDRKETKAVKKFLKLTENIHAIHTNQMVGDIRREATLMMVIHPLP